MQGDGVFQAGHILNDTYRVVRLLSQGGMGSLYEVDHLRLPRKFALKVMSGPSTGSSEYMMRFRREAEILASLDHPNVVQVMDWNVTAESKPYLVMELLSGEDLSQLLSRCGALPPKVALSIFAQAVAALEVAHSQGITHRDLKPANIFLCRDGVVPYFTKVLDFGIAKSVQHTGGLVSSHFVLMGTPAYMSPEQARGDLGGVDARSDQFSLALVLYEMLVGQPAFYRRREPAMLTICRVMQEDPPPLPDVGMNRAVMRALRKSPDERYPSLSEMLTAVLSAAEVSPEQIEVPERTDRICVRGAVQAAKSSVPVAKASPAAPVAPRQSVASPLPPALSVPVAEPAPVQRKPERSRGSYPLGVPVLATPTLDQQPLDRSASAPAKLSHEVVTPPKQRESSRSSDSKRKLAPIAGRNRSRWIGRTAAAAAVMVAGILLVQKGRTFPLVHRIGIEPSREPRKTLSEPQAEPRHELPDLCASEEPRELPDLSTPSVNIEPPAPPPPRTRPVLHIKGVPANSPVATYVLSCVRLSKIEPRQLKRASIDLEFDPVYRLLREMSTKTLTRDQTDLLENCLRGLPAKAEQALTPHKEIKVTAIEEKIP
jgi:serine/threonine protein kinase